ncbi:MAG: sodium/solute symporter [Planctomycetes bacterium]|nr:sodium/solute symporter [Planctomycetota bacterium]
MQAGLSAFDWTVVGLYLALVALIGLYASRDLKTTRDYFLGGRSVPWWAAALSIIATETSAATYIGVPREAYQGDWAFLQLVLGFVLGRLFLAFFFVPAFYRREIVTVYGLLEERFGNTARTVAAALFLVGRVVGSAVRLFAGCLALEVATGLPTPWAIVLLGAFGAAYTLTGGIKAVVWTEVILGATFIAGGAVAAAYLVGESPAGLAGLLSDPVFLEKTRIFHPGLDPSSEKSLLAGLAGGFFLTLATHGTDQDVAQRILTCRSSRGGSLSVVGSAVLILPLMALFLLVGTLLHAFYASRPELHRPADLDHVFPLFIVSELPRGFCGLVMAGLFSVSISSYSSVLNALASTAVSDFYEPLLRRLRRDPRPRHLVLASRLATLLWAGAIVLLAFAFIGSGESVLTIALRVLTYFYGALLGAFLLGIFTRRGSGVSVTAGMLLSVPAVLLFQLRDYLARPPTAPEAIRSILELIPSEAQERVILHVPALAWPYWIILGAGVTFAVGLLGRSRPWRHATS